MNKDKVSVSNRKKALDLAISQIEKQFGRGSIMRLGDDVKLDVEAIPTGILTLDKTAPKTTGSRLLVWLEAIITAFCLGIFSLPYILKRKKTFKIINARNLQIL